MKGKKQVIDRLNKLLADELTAINQYMVHSEMCNDWGYGKLHEAIEKRAIDEMKHAEKLIGRIIFLESEPTVSKLNKIMIGKDIPTQFKNDHAAEVDAIKLCVDQGDNGTREMLEDILEDEENHIDWIESQLDQIDQMGISEYLGEKVG